MTTPAADIADNPYWKRDVRRAYPTLSTVTQGDAVGLLSIGSAAAPSAKLLAGEEGSKQLVSVKEQGQKGLAAYFEAEKSAVAGVLGADGLPPLPVAVRSKSVKAEKYELGHTSYGEKYVFVLHVENSSDCLYFCFPFSLGVGANLCHSYPCRSFV